MNILLTSVGRRGYLVDYFKEALKGDGHVFAANTHARTDGMLRSDHSIVVPKASDPSFPSTLRDLCKQHSVDILISLHDWEIPYISLISSELYDQGTQCIIPKMPIVDTCLDKWKMIQFVESLGLHHPKTFLHPDGAKAALQSAEISYPLILKPRFGHGSIGIEIIHSLEELDLGYSLSTLRNQHNHGLSLFQTEHRSTVLIQEFVDGTEYGLDIVNNLSGEYQCTLIKEKISMRSGETDSAITRNRPPLEACGRTLANHLCHPAIIDVDVKQSKQGVIHILDINPRFGGGYPFSHVAGANIPAAIIAWSRGEEPDPVWLRVQPDIFAYKGIQMHSLAESTCSLENPPETNPPVSQ